MSDILAQMEADLQKYKARYKKLHQQYTSIESSAQAAISPGEKRTLDFIQVLINGLEKKIAQHKLNLANADLQDVINGYQSIINEVNKKFKKVKTTHDQWMKYIYQVGTAYNNAYESFKDIMAKQEKYQADVASFASSIISVAGVGTISWISTTGKFISKLQAAYPKAVNIGEDILQAGFDKVTGHVTSNLPSNPTIDSQTPLAFQNDILVKAINNLLPILRIILQYEGMAMEMQERVRRLRMQPGGKTTGSQMAKREYENYLKMSKLVATHMAPVEEWVKKLPPSSVPSDLLKDFKQAFWSKWLPKLRSVKMPQNTGSNYSNPNPQSTTTYDAWFISSAVTDELTLILDLPGIGVGERGLDRWVSANDIKLLVGWADRYEPKYTF